MLNAERYEIRRLFSRDDPVRRFRIDGLGLDEWMRPGHVNRPGGTGDWLLMYFPQATEVNTAKGVALLPPSTLMVWPGGGGHYYGCGGGMWNHSWIHCDGSAVAAMLRESGLPPGRGYRCEEKAVTRYIRLLYAEMTSHVRPDEDILIGLFRLLLLETHRLNVAGEDIPADMRLARRHIEQHYHEQLRLSGIAAAARLSVPVLCSKFRKYFHASPIDYAIELRLQEAEHLLYDRNRKLSDIAAATGFRDQYYFSRVFTSRRGISPGKWRQLPVRAADPAANDDNTTRGADK
ncbi:MAG: helix-turn-helix transcriptional regulator [Victivallaceae bacterium]|nr:AraC family transcriptional regulator [Victivallaceae bacterium]